MACSCIDNKVNEVLLGKDMFGEIVKPDIKGILKNKFLIPPFSVLSARDGDWQNRKRQWISLGIQSEIGRGGADTVIPLTGNYTEDRIARERAVNITGASPLPEWAQGNNRVANMAPGGSVFDPVLCELMYSWFC